MSDIVPRRTWCALPPARPVARIVTPTPRLWLHHGAAGTSDAATACGYVRYHQRTHGWADIGYSFLIAQGRVLEGRGAGRVGAHTAGDNIGSHGICMVGNYESRLPNTADLDALVWLVRHGIEQGWWEGPITGGHRDAPGASTSCPGRRLWQHIPEINRQILDEGDDMTPAERKMLEDIHREIFTAGDDKIPDGGGSRTLRDRVFQNNAALGRLDGLTPAAVAAEVAKRLPAGTIDVDLLAGKVADVIFARAGKA